MRKGFARFVGMHVVTKRNLPSDRRGEIIPAGTTLFVREMCGDEHFHLHWPGPGGQRAANQVHYKDLMTG
jgi:hypothetical protein